jgi:protein TonB
MNTKNKLCRNRMARHGSLSRMIALTCLLAGLLMKTVCVANNKSKEQTTVEVQQKDTAKTEDERNLWVEKDLYIVEEKLPSYPGGNEALMQFIEENIQIPTDDCGQGRVIVQFVITETGDIADVTVLRGVCPSWDAEAIRLVKAIPKKWNPGEFRGKPVRVKYTLPISFYAHSAQP